MTTSAALGCHGPTRAVRSTVLTPMGGVPLAGLEALRAFGLEADRLEYPRIDVGGIIVPGRDPASPFPPGIEGESYASVTGEGNRTEGRQGKWEGEGAPSAQAAPGETPHAIRHGLTHANLDLPGLVTFHPLARVVATTGKAAYLNIPVGLVRQLPVGARLTLEIPLDARAQLSRAPTLPTPVPDVRAWAAWEGGFYHGQMMVSHHAYPDHAICACLPHEWVLGIHELRDYVAFCALWAAKLVHERLLGGYPGLQHYPESERARRDRKTEYCGCGRSTPYEACCRHKDLQLTAYERWNAGYAARDRYLSELRWQGRPSGPPMELVRRGLRRVPTEVPAI